MQTRVLVFTGGALILLGVGGILIIMRAREVDTVADGGGAFADNRSIPEVIKNTASQAIAGELQTLYQVKKGDNLFGIAKRFGVSVRAIKDANHDKHDILAVDQWLVIPK